MDRFSPLHGVSDTIGGGLCCCLTHQQAGSGGECLLLPSAVAAALPEPAPSARSGNPAPPGARGPDSRKVTSWSLMTTTLAGTTVAKCIYTSQNATEVALFAIHLSGRLRWPFGGKSVYILAGARDLSMLTWSWIRTIAVWGASGNHPERLRETAQRSHSPVFERVSQWSRK